MGAWNPVGRLDEAAAATLPEWLTPMADAIRGLQATDLTRWLPTTDKGRHAAVLVCLAHGDQGPDVLLIERAARMRAHAGQPAFPGGAVDPGDDGPIAAALREAVEETGLDASGVVPFGVLPDLWVPVSNFVVTPIVAWWQHPSEISPASAQEVARVERVTIAELVEPENRAWVRHPSGYMGAGFEVRDMLVWGFTAGILNVMLDRAGWAKPWDRSRIVSLPDDEPEIDE